MKRRLFCASALAGGLVAGLGMRAYAADPQAALAELKNKVLSHGPNGENPTPAADVKLSDAELAKIKSMHARAAIVLHYGGNDWSRAQVKGLKAQFGDMGIDVIAVTDAGFKAEKQVADI